MATLLGIQIRNEDGINLPRLGTEDGRRAIFPLPPTTEQKRIVEKCDRLLSIYDEIEKRQQQKEPKF
ncbi:hypothetical protein [Halotia branconii]|uniref:Type I restriction modification DNA specificity domain-containing protein n=1 Tax=Halotia branconii CENA392 TaxID=1539056 RepID=A0AAJ6PA44_9CYAN|nr:hypothetical protein [Halotia branconii]WGV26396.1 hypothetical protein QI031_02460 [Halotia branconii CENA392]